MASVLCVSGMHRSGTSLITGWLERCGLIVDNGQRLAVTEGNPKGHYEDAEMALLQHQAVLQTYPASKGWQVLDEYAPQKLTLPSQARKLVEQRNHKYPLWGWKDPRSVHFLGAWKELIPDLKVLLVWRPCDQVVVSLVRRAKQAGQGTGGFLDITVSDAETLWLNSNQHILGYLQKYGGDSILVSLDQVIQNGKRLIALINERFLMNLEGLSVAESFDKSLLQRGETGSFRPTKPARVDEITMKLNALSVELDHVS